MLYGMNIIKTVKSTTEVRHGTGIRRRVASSSKFPKNWKRGYLLAIVFLCFSPGLIGYFVLLSLRNVLLLCNRSEHVSRRA